MRNSLSWLFRNPGFQEILNYISESVIIFDSTPRVVMMNKASCEMINSKFNAWIGKTPDEYLETGDVDRSILKIAIKNKKETSGMIYNREGKEFLTKCRPFFNADGSLQFAVSTTMSLNELNALKVRLQKERRQTEKYKQENEHLRKYIMLANEHIFQNQGMHEMMSFVKKVAPLDCTILIMGESGVGKEVLAKAVHANSSRRRMPFIPVTIPAIPENLLEAEIFGYEQGAFTGSKRGGKPGMFEMAQGGTLFLDEVGDIPLNVQVKILRAIENQEVMRLGGTRSIKLDVRIISATNKNMHDEIKNGHFREDLYYRLNVVPFIISPLRERRNVIIPLSLSFLEEYNSKYELNKRFSDSALHALSSYNWPGNIRELKNVVERLSVLTDQQIITDSNVRAVIKGADHLPIPVGRHEANADKNEITKSIISEYEDYELSQILEALKQAKGRKNKAAQILGISRSTLYNKLKRQEPV